MSRSPAPRFLLCLFLVLLAGSAALASESGWTLWKNNGIAGVVSVRSADGIDRVGIKRMAEILGCHSVVSGDRLRVTSGKRTLEFVLGAAAARREGGQILPLAAAVKAEEGEWWTENRGALRLFESLLSSPKAVVRLRFAGTGPLPEKPDPPAALAEASSTDLIPEPREATPSVYGPLPQLRGIRWSRTGERTRAVLDLSAAVETDVKTFPGSVELTLRAASSRSLSGVPSPYAGDVSVGITQFGDKIVVRFQHSAASVKTFPLHKPERLVVDFLAQGAKEEPALPPPASVEPGPKTIPVEPPPASLPPPVFPGKRPDGKPFLIAVDAGHGGHDPGAVAGGFQEKSINLKAAKRLVELLMEAGLEGRLTRRDDTYLRLNERTEFANRWNADLFISLHCNALPRGRHARGVEIYLMALPTDKDAMQLALFENRELGKNNTVQNADAKTNLLLKILGDMEQNAKIGQSTSLAESLFGSGRRAGLPMSRVAQAPFFVLRGAAMPAVLVEMGYLTEPEDRRLLNDPAFMDRLLRSLVSGMSAYLKTLTR
jgi:N-acetylmuramoyl-L-alanine amidase